MTTVYHSKYFAHELSRIGGKGVERLGRALFDATVDLNPHQIESALFALRSPVSKGAILADEVGLGKTIEAGLVLCQYWSEKRRHLLVVCPASLRKQWANELSEKFNLPAFIIDAKTFKEKHNKTGGNPFREKQILICSFHFASNKAELIKEIPWNLIVIDEAHKLRNSYRQSNHIGQRIKWATQDKQKLLLTATPLQNSLLELYGLASLIDERIFGDVSSFRAQYLNYGGDLPGLRERLSGFCWRTLRSQVTEFIQYTERKLITRPFKPSEQEQKLYNAVSEYLQRESSYALPSGQKHLLVLLVRKVLASSPRALAGTLEMMRERLVALQEKYSKQEQIDSESKDWLEILDEELVEELFEEELDSEVTHDNVKGPSVTSEQNIDLDALNKEINELDDYIRWARSIGIDTKSKSLLTALDVGFQKMSEMGAAKKAVIFTESRRTQVWLKEFLETHGYTDQVLTFNGSNNDEYSKLTYQKWITNNEGAGKITGSKAIDIRAALIDAFREEKSILISTEAGAEGLNLQFCSLIINFDLPWNPQRIEQRIGRCHRYGQKFDVVVINFLNERNEADRRVHELLDLKFNLFTGVFGASDEVLGNIESGMDFEKRILAIYQSCRSQDEIEQAFKELQTEMDEKIQSRMQDTRKILMDHFDEDVHDRLNANLTGTRAKLDLMSRMFWTLTHQQLEENADFNETDFSFNLYNPPLSTTPKGSYHLISKQNQNVVSDYLYRLSHPLGEYVLQQGKALLCPTAEVFFDISNHPTRISLIEALKGNSGWLSLSLLRIESFDQDDYLLFSGFDDQGVNLDQEVCEKLFSCKATGSSVVEITPEIDKKLSANNQRHIDATIAKNLEENNQYFNEARDQLDKWAEDMEMAAQKDLDEIKRKIRDLQRQSRQAPTVEEQLAIQEDIASLERKKRSLRERIFDIEDEIADKRDRLVETLEQRMKQKTYTETLFKIRWKVI